MVLYAVESVLRVGDKGNGGVMLIVLQDFEHVKMMRRQVGARSMDRLE